MKAPATRGYPSIAKFVGAAAAVVAVLAGWRMYDRRPLPATIDVVLPLSAKELVVVRRDQRGWDRGSEYNDSYLQAIDADKGELWHQVIPHASVDAMLSPFLHAVVAVGDSLVVRGRVRVGTHDQIKIFSYNSSNGQPTWSATPFPASNSFEPNFHVSLLVPSADMVLVFANEIDAKASFGKVVRIVALDAKTGAERWRAQEDDSLTSTFRLRGNALVVTDFTKLRVIDLATGQDRAKLAYSGKPCVGTTDAWFVDAGGLEELHFDDLKLRPHPKPPLEGFALLGACGHRSGKAWFLAGDETSFESGPKRRWLVSLDPASNAEASLLYIGTFEQVPGVNDDAVATDLSPFEGDLDRFVPMVVSGDMTLTATGATKSLGGSVLMLDLDGAQSNVAWQSATADAISQITDALWHAGNVDLYANYRNDAHTITSFDPATGQMTASLQRPEHSAWSAAFGQVWINDDDRVAAFDAKTLAKTWSTGDVRTTDAAAATKTLLAPVPPAPAK